MNFLRFSCVVLSNSTVWRAKRPFSTLNRPEVSDRGQTWHRKNCSEKTETGIFAGSYRPELCFVQNRNNIQTVLCKIGTTSQMFCAKSEQHPNCFVQNQNNIPDVLCKIGTTSKLFCAKSEQHPRCFVQNRNSIQTVLCKIRTTSQMFCAKSEQHSNCFVQNQNNIPDALCKIGTTSKLFCAKSEQHPNCFVQSGISTCFVLSRSKIETGLCKIHLAKNRPYKFHRIFCRITTSFCTNWLFLSTLPFSGSS